MMSHENEQALRRSMDAIDSVRRRITMAGWFTMAFTFGVYGWLAYVVRTSDSPKKLLMTAVFALTCMIATSTYAMAVFSLRMTRRILRAVELSAR